MTPSQFFEEMKKKFPSFEQKIEECREIVKKCHDMEKYLHEPEIKKLFYDMAKRLSYNNKFMIAIAYNRATKYLKSNKKYLV